MKAAYYLLSRCVMLGLLLLGSCTKEREQPVPVNEQPIGADIQQLKQLFLDKKYDQQLNEQVTNASQSRTNPTWTPQWDKVSQQRTTEQATYFYVPLLPKISEKPYVITLVGVQEYLVIKRSSEGTDFSVVTYLRDDLRRDSKSLSVTPNSSSYFVTFTGIVLLRQLATNKNYRFAYLDGVKQESREKASRPSTSASTRGFNGGATTNDNCQYYMTCWWTGHDFSGSVTYGRITSGYNECPEPNPDQYMYGGNDITWDMTSSTTEQQCDGSGSGPDPGPGPGDGGGSGSGDDGGPYDPGTFVITDRAATDDPDFPSDCSSWQFQAVGPSGYMACGVTGIEIDLLSQFQNPDGSYGLALNLYKANLFFEMPPRYSPGEAATICAQIKDQVEEILEDAYRNQYPPDIALTINARFIREMGTRIAAYGGRITQRPQYPNTPVGPYGHTILPNNGGCF